MPLAKTAALALSIAFTALTLTLAASAGAADLRIAPADTTVQVGATFTLRVVCDAVPDLKGLETAYSFSATRLKFLAMPAGNVFTDQGGAWFAQVIADAAAPADTAWLDAAMLDGSAQGPGVVAYITFKALVPGDAPLHCVLAEMRDSNNVPLLPTCEGGMVHVLAPVPTVRSTWGRVKTHSW